MRSLRPAYTNCSYPEVLYLQLWRFPSFEINSLIDWSFPIQYRLFLPFYRMFLDDKTIEGFPAFVERLFQL
nr:MAG TPA: hypothetical protein [Caudoviricetes sp.]